MSHSQHRLAYAMTQPGSYLQQIDRLQQKLILRNRLYETTQEDVSFYQFCMHRHRVANILANSVKHEDYYYQAARPRLIQTKTKQRTVYIFEPSDRLVQSVLHAAITPYVQQIISPSVHSYIPGRSHYQAARLAAQFFKQHKACYVLRSDIVAYTDNIPTTNDSLLWQQYQKLLRLIDPSHSLPEYIWSLIVDGIRPLIRSDENQDYQLAIGLPQGAPLTTTAANLYLQPIDNLLSTIPGGFYARFGDDLLFAHPDVATLLETEDLLNKQLATLKLYRNSDKDEYTYLTSNGRKGQSHQHFHACHRVNFLGLCINQNGTLGIARHINHRLLRELKQRIRNTIELVAGQNPTATHGPSICQMLNHNFQQSAFLGEPRVKQLLGFCTDRQQLKQLDYQIAMYLAEQLSGHRGVRAFRHINYRTIRQEWKLQSLCVLRNHMRAPHANT